MLFYPEKCFWIDEVNDVCTYDDICDDFLHSQGIIYAGVTKVKFGDRVLNVITCDSNFLELDENTRNFLIYHEVGHVIHNHTNMNTKQAKYNIIKRSLGILPKMEIQADCYAASVIGKDAAKLALRSLISNKKLIFVSRFEMFKRFIKVK